MQQLTTEGTRLVEDLARRHGFSIDAVTAMVMACATSGGGMAQFNHPEFGGMGQWTNGGMIMIGDMFNNALKARVDALCRDIAGFLAHDPLLQPVGGGQWQSQSSGTSGSMGGSMGGASGTSLFIAGSGNRFGGWWPADLGQPSSTGQQNNIRYAVFPTTRRLAIDIGGTVTVYDTLDHQIGGVSQQQGGDASLTFTSQYGVVYVRDLPVVGDQPPSATPAAAPTAQPAPAAPAAETPAPPPAPAAPVAAQPVEASAAPAAPATPPVTPPVAQQPPAQSPDGIMATLELLAGLRDRGILSDEEFSAKKAELLSRL